MDRQLCLPEILPWERPRSQETIERVEARVNICVKYLSALHISYKAVTRILSDQQNHWKKVSFVSGSKERICYLPSPELKKILARLAKWLFRQQHFSRSDGVATAFYKESSIILNAEWHVYNRSSLWLDVKDAFQSIKAKHISRYLLRHHGPPYFYEKLCDNDPEPEDIRADFFWIVSRLLTYNGRLRQGSSSSPLVFNLLMDRFDKEMIGGIGAPSCRIRDYTGSRPSHLYCIEDQIVSLRDVRIVYTRYGDDLCFSSQEEVFPEELKANIFAIIAKHNLQINWKKTREGKNGIMEFPGVVIVGKRIRPQNKYIKSLAEKIKRGGMSKKSLAGHRAFLHQFGHPGSLRVLRSLLGKAE